MNRSVIFLSFLLSLFILNSCGERYSYSKNEKMVCGLKLVSPDLKEIGIIGNPNNYGYQLQVFPSPAYNVINIQTWNKDNPIKNVWILEGKSSDLFESIDFTESINYKYKKEEIQEEAITALSYEDIKETKISIKVANLEKGLYKVFAEYESGKIEWFNFYKTNNEDLTIDASDKKKLEKSFKK
jgi:hypothetical protein